MRLIDVDEYKGKVIVSHCYSGVNKIIRVDDIPTAYDVDKVVEELEKLKGEKEMGTSKVVVKECIEIVKQGLKEQK